MIPQQDLERVTEALRKWAEAFQQGHLNQKETSLDAEFMQKIFGEALGYRSVSESPNDYHREKNPHCPPAPALPTARSAGSPPASRSTRSPSSS